MYPQGEAIFQSLQSDVQDLTFRLGYKPSLGEKLGILIERLARYKPSVWGDKRFYILLGTIYGVLLYATLLQILHMSSSGGKCAPNHDSRFPSEGALAASGEGTTPELPEND